MRARIAVAAVGLFAPAAHADHHGMVMADPERSAFGASLQLLAATFGNVDYIGEYQGVVPAVGWANPKLAAGASFPMYRLVENGREVYGVGDLVAHGQATVFENHELHAGVVAAVSVPTGDNLAGLGMGHVMAMPALWGAWARERLTLIAAGGFSRALADVAGHDHGPWPLVEPMNLSEITWSAMAELAIGDHIRGGGRLSGGIPVGEPGHDRVIGAARVAWGRGRLDTAAEIQAGLDGDPFTIRGVVETALHF